jgi:hypothetical protein
MSYAVFAIGYALFCLLAPFHVTGSLLSGRFEDAAALSVMIAVAAVSLRFILRADNTVWMTPDGIEFGDKPTRVPWHHVVDATPFLYGAPGFHTLTFNDGTPDLHFIAGANAYKRLQRAKARQLSPARSS